MKRKSEILGQEKKFHDEWASKINIDDIKISTYFEGATSPENRFILQNLGNVNGKSLLDLGCGAGENAVYFAQKGAICTAADCSSGMVNTAMTLAAKHKVEIKGKIIDALSLDFPDNTFDIVYCSNLFHHVDFEPALKETHRVLKTGGKLCFWDPLKHNPVINIYRKIAKNVRTDDENPLDINIIKLVERVFSNVSYDTFWIATLWIFIRFFLIEKADPNQERYWKKIIYEEERLRGNYNRLERIDDGIKKMAPYLKKFAWNIAVVATK
jgi:ubiquinone/menaquinone biosynthesis C-methylase UbiE